MALARESALDPLTLAGESAELRLAARSGLSRLTTLRTLSGEAALRRLARELARTTGRAGPTLAGLTTRTTRATGTAGAAGLTGSTRSSGASRTALPRLELTRLSTGTTLLRRLEQAARLPEHGLARISSWRRRGKAAERGHRLLCELGRERNEALVRGARRTWATGTSLSESECAARTAGTTRAAERALQPRR